MSLVHSPALLTIIKQLPPRLASWLGDSALTHISALEGALSLKCTGLNLVGLWLIHPSLHILCTLWQIVQHLCLQHMKLSEAALVVLRCFWMAFCITTWCFMWSWLRFLRKKKTRCQILHLRCQVLTRLKCQILPFKCQVLFTFEVPGFVLQVPGFGHVEVPGFALQVPGLVPFQVPGFVLFQVPGFVQKKSARKRTSLPPHWRQRLV